MDKLVAKMKELGFTAYESKAYLALLHQNPATGYELSKVSGVPRSAIYDVVKRLEALGFVNAISSNPKRFIPLPPDRMMEILERRMSDKVSSLKKELEQTKIKVEVDHLWNINGYDNMIQKAQEMIDSAKDEIFISLWRREASQLHKSIEAANQRGVNIIMFSFTELPFAFGQIFSHNIPEEELEGILQHKIILVRDHKELLMGSASKRDNEKIAWTRNKAILSIACDHMILDITLFGQRFGVDIIGCVKQMNPRKFEKLDELIKYYHPDDRFAYF